LAFNQDTEALTDSDMRRFNLVELNRRAWLVPA
jgi:hypothetical protein